MSVILKLIITALGLFLVGSFIWGLFTEGSRDPDFEIERDGPDRFKVYRK